MATQPIELDLELVTEFVLEASEQLAASDQQLLDLEADTLNEDARSAIFRCFHTIKGLSGFMGFQAIERLAHASEDLLDQAATIPLDGPSTDAVFQAIDLLRELVEDIEAAVPEGVWTPGDPGEIDRLIETTKFLHDARAEAGAPIDAPHPETPSTDVDVQTSAATDDKPGPRRPRHSDSIRVDSARLDRLVDLIGELVITESILMGSIEATSGGDPSTEWQQHLTRQGKITREIHELAGSLRMIPVRPTFQKMARLARDVAKKADKKIEFITEGEDAELDKTLVDQLSDPLVHLVRNSIDHGLEPDPQERVDAGKPAIGRVTLRAGHQAGKIEVQIIDDGRGLDLDAIRAKAIRNGLVEEDASPSDRELMQSICEPGFSTATEVTEISGRGVGMDVVKRSIEAMGGTLEIHSERGVGTTITLQLPLTLAVIDGMVVKVGPERYIFPTLSVVRLVTPQPGDIVKMLGREELIRVAGELVPLVRLDEQFGVPIQPGAESIAVIAESEHQKVAVLIETVLDQQQVVIKSLDDSVNNEGLAGCAIMPDGGVGLVLDVAALVAMGRDEANRPHKTAATG